MFIENCVGGGGHFRSFMKIIFTHKYEQLVSVENLLAAWREFSIGKTNNKDVQQFTMHLIDNIVQLHEDLANKLYSHGGYDNFAIADPFMQG